MIRDQIRHIYLRRDEFMTPIIEAVSRSQGGVRNVYISSYSAIITTVLSSPLSTLISDTKLGSFDDTPCHLALIISGD